MQRVELNRLGATALGTEDLYWVPTLVCEGLLAVYLCKHGIGRSYKAAEKSTREGVLSAFFEGGFEELERLDKKAREEAIDKLVIIPRRYATLCENEARVMRKLINKIGAEVIYHEKCGD